MNTEYRVDTPFAGFYQSFYDSELEYAHEVLGDEEAEVMIDKLDASKFNKTISGLYIDFLNEKLEELFKVPALLSEPAYHPMTPQNRGDDVSAVLAVSILPTLDELEALSDSSINFKELLIQIAKDKLTSHDGFSSFYSPEIAPYFDKPYDQWGFAYLTCLLFGMVAALGYEEGVNEHDIESWAAAQYDLELNCFAQEYLAKTGGVIDIALDSQKEGDDHE